MFRSDNGQSALVFFGHSWFVADRECNFLPGFNYKLVGFQEKVCGAFHPAVVLNLLLAGVGDLDVLRTSFTEHGVELDFSFGVLLRYFEEQFEDQHEHFTVGGVGQQVHIGRILNPDFLECVDDCLVVESDFLFIGGYMFEVLERTESLLVRLDYCIEERTVSKVEAEVLDQIAF